jgi:phosphoglucosamine mutase
LPWTLPASIVDGDQIMGILAVAMKERGKLAARHPRRDRDEQPRAAPGDGARARHPVLQTGVGDRYVLEEMKRRRLLPRRRAVGHVIMLDHGTTGDGVLTGLMLAARMAATGRTIADLGTVMTRLPQVLVNVRGVDKNRVESDEGLQDAVRREEAALAGSGRVLLRKSGTEPLVRVMVEAPTQDEADAVAHRLAGVVRERLTL